MMRFFRILSVMFALACYSPCVLSSVAYAREKDKKEAKAPPLDPRTGKRLNKAIEELEAGKTGAARSTLESINLDRASPYEKSRVEQLFAAIDQMEEKYSSARQHLEKALSSGGLNDQEMSATRFQIAKLLIVEEKWAEGVKALEAWFASEPKPNSSAYYTLAAAYYQLGNYDAAVTPAQKAVDLAGDKVQESWLQLLLAIRAQREEYSLAYPTLLRLIERLPDNKVYWMQAASVALSMDKYDTATAMLQLAHTAGFLTTGDEIQRLVELLAHEGIPYRAARILSEALDRKQVPASTKNYELAGNFWIAAHEYGKAIEWLERAGEASDNGDPYVRLAEVHVQREEWGKAVAALERAMSKGNLKRPGSAKMLMGIALYNEKKVRDARSWFERARAHSETRSQADGWVRQIDTELEGDA